MVGHVDIHCSGLWSLSHRARVVALINFYSSSTVVSRTLPVNLKIDLHFVNLPNGMLTVVFQD